MRNYSFINAPTLPDALDALDRLREKAWLVAGGTNVMVFIRAGKRDGTTLVNIRDITALSGISEKDGIVTIGAGTTISAIASSDILKESAPGLYAVANQFADPTTRNSATIGGNVANGTAGGDMLPSLLVLDAIAHVESKADGRREIPLSEIFTGPGKTSIASNEILTHLTFRATRHIGAIKLGARKSMSIAIATVAAYVKMKDDTIASCRIALGAVSATPGRARNAEAAVTGRKLDNDTFDLLAVALQKDMSPRDPSVRSTASYRRSVVPVLVKRAMMLAATGECM
jgi:CO/xanthine dehydrogenase FAD-binding subunit